MLNCFYQGNNTDSQTSVLKVFSAGEVGVEFEIY